MESQSRSLAKTMTWRIIATLITAGVAFALTGKIVLAATIGLVDTLIKLGAYYAHERAWNRVMLGRRRSPEYQI